MHRLGVGERLRRTLASTNPIRSTVPVDRRESSAKRETLAPEVQSLRWTATGLLEAQTKFRRVKGYHDAYLDALQHRLNPSLTQRVRVA